MRNILGQACGARAMQLEVVLCILGRLLSSSVGWLWCIPYTTAGALWCRKASSAKVQAGGDWTTSWCNWCPQGLCRLFQMFTTSILVEFCCFLPIFQLSDQRIFRSSKHFRPHGSLVFPCWSILFTSRSSRKSRAFSQKESNVQMTLFKNPKVTAITHWKEEDVDFKTERIHWASCPSFHSGTSICNVITFILGGCLHWNHMYLSEEGPWLLLDAFPLSSTQMSYW